MIILLNVSDLMDIRESTTCHCDILKLQIQKVLDQMLPEKSTYIVAAAEKLTAVLKLPNLSSQQLQVINLLLNCFRGIS